MGGSTLHHVGVQVRGVFIRFLVGGFCKEFIVAISEFEYLYLEVWVGCKGALCVGLLEG